MRIVHVVGVRPNYPKIAPLVRALASLLPDVEQVIADTGQHYDDELAGAIRSRLALPPPTIRLYVGSATREEQIARTRERFVEALSATRFDAVVVAGDANSTLGCALAATDRALPVIHVEAGLRCFDSAMAEEKNRVATDHMSALLLAPSVDAVENLRAEGIDASRIRQVGNLMIDSVAAELPAALAQPGPEGHALVTLHRSENVDEPVVLGRLVEAIVELGRDGEVLFPLHPRTRAVLEGTTGMARLAAAPGVRILPPMGYREFLALEARARVVLTDSGGVQEETSFLGVPCVTLRERTERPITVTTGTNVVVGTDTDRILAAVRVAATRRRSTPPGIEGWDGRAAPRAAQAIAELLG